MDEKRTAIYDKFEENLRNELVKLCTEFGMMDRVLLSSEDIDGKWDEFGRDCMIDAVREFNEYPEVVLAWAGYLGMAVACRWGGNWQAHKNDRYQAIRHTVDRRIIKGYKLWKSNFIAYDMVNNTTKYADRYDSADVESFQDYIRHRLRKAERSLDREELKDIFLKIYSNPVSEKESRGFEI